MRGPARRAALAATGRWARSRLPVRSARLAGQAGARPSFTILADWPEWLGLPEDRQRRIGAIAALLGAREALADEIDGARLRIYAEAVGSEALEAIVACPDSGGAVLPSPDGLARLSAEMLAACLDAAAARLAQLTPRHDRAAAALVRRAEDICRRIPAR